MRPQPPPPPGLQRLIKVAGEIKCGGREKLGAQGADEGRENRMEEETKRDVHDVRELEQASRGRSEDLTGGQSL